MVPRRWSWCSHRRSPPTAADTLPGGGRTPLCRWCWDLQGVDSRFTRCFLSFLFMHLHYYPKGINTSLLQNKTKDIHRLTENMNWFYYLYMYSTSFQGKEVKQDIHGYWLLLISQTSEAMWSTLSMFVPRWSPHQDHKTTVKPQSFIIKSPHR